MLWPDNMKGKMLFAAAKLFILSFPIVWHLLVSQEQMSFSRSRQGGLLGGFLIGLGLSVFIIVFYEVFGVNYIDSGHMRVVAANAGLGTSKAYAWGAVYYIFLNALMEEYVWRWFVTSQCEKITSPITAVIISASAFSAHHLLALQMMMKFELAVVSTGGIFIGAVIWSWCYLKYQSIWPGYISHAVVDITLFWIGYRLLFMAVL